MRVPRIAYDGGRDAVEMLIRRLGENHVEWGQRCNHYRNVPVTKRGVNKKAWLVYGSEPELEVWIGDRPPSFRAQVAARQNEETLATDSSSADYAEWVRDVLEVNNNARLVFQAAIQRIRYGQAACKLWVDEELDKDKLVLRMDLFARWDVRPIFDPNDPDVLLGVVEARVEGDEVKWRLCTADEVVWVKPDLSVTSDAGAHPVPGVIPWTFFGDGEPLIWDLIEYQKVLINRHSTNWAVDRSTAFPVVVMSGDLQNEEKNIQGVEGIDIGGGLRYLKFQDPQGGATVLNPNANAAHLQESYEKELQEALWLGAGLPTDAQAQGASPEQPTTVALRWLDSFIDRDQLITEAHVFEDQRQTILAHYGTTEVGGMSYDVDAVDWEITFKANPLPHDDRADREQDRTDVVAGLRLRGDYVKEHVVPESDPDEHADYMEELEKESGSSSGGNPFDAPELDEDEEPEEREPKAPEPPEL